MNLYPPNPAGDHLWHWPGWLPAGFLTLLVGPVSSGKSALALHIAGCIHTGRSWPDGTPNNQSPGTIIWFDHESSHFLNQERAGSWEIPIRGFLFPSILLSNGPLDFLNANHRRLILHATQKLKTRLIVIDSLLSLFQHENTTNTTRIITRLGQLAQAAGIPILATHHLRKPRPGQKNLVTLDRIYGPTAVIQYPRVIWAIDTPEPPSNPRRLMVLKNNLTTAPPPLDFSIADHGLSFTPAPQRFSSALEPALDRAARFLVDLLTDAPVPAKKVFIAAQAAGHAEITLRRAKNYLDIMSFRDRDQWYWSFYNPDDLWIRNPDGSLSYPPNFPIPYLIQSPRV